MTVFPSRSRNTAIRRDFPVFFQFPQKYRGRFLKDWRLRYRNSHFTNRGCPAPTFVHGTGYRSTQVCPLFAKIAHMGLPNISSAEFIGLSRSEMPTEACLRSAARLIAKLECAESRPYMIRSDLHGGLEFVWSNSATRTDVTIIDRMGDRHERSF